MLKGYKYLIVFIITFLACSKDEEDDNTFISKGDITVSLEDIKGTWHVFAGEFRGEVVQIPPNFMECGHSYFTFSDNGVYEEVLYDNFNCIPIKEFANWKIEDGIIKISNTKGEKEELKIIEFKPTELVVNFKYDFDNDGTQDLFKGFLRPYNPISNNHVSNSFEQDPNEATVLRFRWKQETDVDSFSSYEVYRSREGNCSKEDAILLTKIDNISSTEFVDNSPPPTNDNLCYFLRIYSNNDLIGESELLTVNPSELKIPGTFNLNTVNVDGENIFLEWDKKNIPYFSHYEIIYSNFDGINISGIFGEEGTLISIDNFEENSFLITDPPYMENPFYSIKVFNIFGASVVSNHKKVIFKRKDLIGPINLDYIEVDDEESAIYLYGFSQIPEWANFDSKAVLRYNYNAGLNESATSEGTFFSERIPFRKPFNFPEGRTLVVNGGSNMHFLNPVSLTEKFSFSSFYLVEEFNLAGIVDFIYTKNDFLVVLNSSSIYVFQKNGEELMLIDQQIHYTINHGNSNYRMLEINNNEILVGHKSEQESIVFTIDKNGLLKNKRAVSLPLSSNYIRIYKNTSFYSDSNNYLINYGDRTLYSTLTFDSVLQMPENLFALGLAKGSKYIYASTNNPDWFGSDVKTKLLKREIILFETETSEIQSIKTRGYPVRVFENNIGEVFSISIPENQSEFNFDIFVEKVNFR